MSGKSGDAAAERAARHQAYKDFLSGAGNAKYCCPNCTFRRGTREVYENPCKRGNTDSGPQKELCVNSSEERYHPKK
jgi:hypothetical protein